MFYNSSTPCFNVLYTNIKYSLVLNWTKCTSILGFNLNKNLSFLLLFC